ncbi:MAG: M20/M25/M40 family metallo-hydrolase [Planctomycetaceae bacterium]|nr:M20/M25/M40 family metallo-hydrolase [Planctomycetaceae bacterium]
MKLNEKRAIDLVMQLIAIPGGSGHEADVAAFIREQLLNAGVAESGISFDTAHRKSPAGGNTGNMYVKLKGSRKGVRRLLMAHMDTVPIAVGCVPVREGEWIRPKSPATALGGDNRAGCAVVLVSIIEALEQGLEHPPLTLLFSVQEEIGLRGVRYMTPAKCGNPGLCFNWDGRIPELLITGAVGASNLTITIHGIPSHAGVHPEQGVNAMVAASTAVADLQSNGWHGLVIKGKKQGTSNFGIVNGGDATNVVMPRIVIEAEARSHDAAFRDRIVAEFEKAFSRAVRSVRTTEGRTGELVFEVDQRYQAFHIAESESCVRIAKQAAASLGLTASAQSSNGGLDANWMSEHGMPTVTMGCGQHQIHTVSERLNIPEFLMGCRMGLTIATGREAGTF